MEQKARNVNRFIKRLIISFAIILFLFSFKTNAQDTIEEASFNFEGKDNPSYLILKNYKLEGKVLRKYCIKSVTFFKFRLNEKAQIDTIMYDVNVGTPKEILEATFRAIKATNGYWLPRKINGVAVKSRYFLYPVAYSLINACEKDDKEFPIVDKTWEAVTHMTDSYMLDCVILSGMETYTMRPDKDIKGKTEK